MEQSETAADRGAVDVDAYVAGFDSDDKVDFQSCDGTAAGYLLSAGERGIWTAVHSVGADEFGSYYAGCDSAGTPDDVGAPYAHCNGDECCSHEHYDPVWMLLLVM